MSSKAKNGRVLLVWDDEGEPQVGDWTTVLWRQFSDINDSSAISIVNVVEQKAVELRARYLKWIYDLGVVTIDGKKVIDHLLLRPSFSFWWVTSFAQKFNVSGSSKVDDAIKALALESLILEKDATTIRLISSDRALARCIEAMSKSRGVSFEWLPVNALKAYHIPKFYSSLIHKFSALIYFLWFTWQVLPWLFTKKPKSIRFGNVVFIDLLVHLDKKALTSGQFVSNYWTILVDKLTEWGAHSNWLHIYFRHSAVSSPVAAKRLVKRFNDSSSAGQSHVIMEQHVNLNLLGKALLDFWKISRNFARLRSLSQLQPESSLLDLWALHEDEWQNSICGKEAIRNCLRLSLVEAAVSDLPPQKCGIYIAENQPWEMALIYAWKAAGHGVLVGAPHTTVRFWDLRYHYHARTYVRQSKSDLPMPDMLAVNGGVAKHNMLESGYPSVNIFEAEALRYTHLIKPKYKVTLKPVPTKGIKVLICGDFLKKTTINMLNWIDNVAKLLPDENVYIFKSHPAYQLAADDFVTMQLKVSDGPLPDLLAACDVVFTSNITSAAVDAYCAGVPVIQMLDNNGFNVSPLRGLKNVSYAHSPQELFDALATVKSGYKNLYDKYFYLNRDLPRWRKILETSGVLGKGC
jgi:surface carbohydrate biosynthesis protein (TIGR04326 family)